MPCSDRPVGETAITTQHGCYAEKLC